MMCVTMWFAKHIGLDTILSENLHNNLSFIPAIQVCNVLNVCNPIERPRSP